MFRQISFQFGAKRGIANSVHDCQAVLAIEMLARAIKVTLNEEQRYLMVFCYECYHLGCQAKLQLPFEAPFTAIFVKTFRMFSVQSVGVDKYWERVL